MLAAVASAVALILALRNAVDGREDATGFHETVPIRSARTSAKTERRQRRKAVERELELEHAAAQLVRH